MSDDDASDLTYSHFGREILLSPFDLHPHHQAQLIRVHDGDTALFRVLFEAGISAEIWVRLEGLNTPELHGPDPERASQAAEALRYLLASGSIWVKLTGDMTFARYVGRVYVIQDGRPIDASEALAQYNVPQGQ